MANILVNIEKGIEVAAEDLLKWVGAAQSKATTQGPGVIAGIATLCGAVEKALADAAAGASNPTTLVLNLGTDINDVKAVWPAIKTFLSDFGVKI